MVTPSIGLDLRSPLWAASSFFFAQALSSGLVGLGLSTGDVLDCRGGVGTREQSGVDPCATDHRVCRAVGTVPYWSVQSQLVPSKEEWYDSR
jgi:hypothetical protein